MESTELSLSPEKQELLKKALNIQEQTICGCIEIFGGFIGSSDPEVASTSEEALRLINRNIEVLNAMVDALVATKH
jgi:hypothetical protein